MRKGNFYFFLKTEKVAVEAGYAREEEKKRRKSDEGWTAILSI